MKNVLVRITFVLGALFATGCDEAPCPDKPVEITAEDTWLCTFANLKDGKVGIDLPCGGEENVECCYGLICAEGTCQVNEKNGRVGAPCSSTIDCIPELHCGLEGECRPVDEYAPDPEWCLP